MTELKQQTFSDMEYSDRKRKTKCEEFLDIMNGSVPWDERGGDDDSAVVFQRKSRSVRHAGLKPCRGWICGVAQAVRRRC